MLALHVLLVLVVVAVHFDDLVLVADLVVHGLVVVLFVLVADLVVRGSFIAVQFGLETNKFSHYTSTKLVFKIFHNPFIF